MSDHRWETIVRGHTLKEITEAALEEADRFFDVKGVGLTFDIRSIGHETFGDDRLSYEATVTAKGF